MSRRAVTERELLRRLGATVARLRRQQGWTQAALAEQVGIDGRSLQRIEAGRAAPSLTRLHELAEALNVPVAQLLQGPDPDQETRAEDTESTPTEATVVRAWRRVPRARRGLALALLELCARRDL